jgi:hypothetical protein
MIWGRPINLWTGLLTLISGAVATTAIAAGADPVLVATLIGPWTAVLGAVILFVANQPATISVGDSYTVVTPGDAPNVQKVANSNPTPPAIEIPK